MITRELDTTYYPDQISRAYLFKRKFSHLDKVKILPYVCPERKEVRGCKVLSNWLTE